MAQMDDLYTALKNADAAGDTAGAQRLAAYIQSQGTQAQPMSYLDRVGANIATTGRDLGNLAAGAVRGAGSIGATILAPVDAAARAMGVQNDYIGRTDRREAMTGALQGMGADSNSLPFKAGKLGAEVAGTAGAGGLIGRATAPILTKIAPEVAPSIVNALASNGFRTGANSLGPVANVGIRALGGGVAGGAQVGLVDPEDAGKAALIGAALPGAAKLVGSTANMLVRPGSVGGAGRAGAAQAAQEAGYVLPPTDINPSPVNSILEGLSGKIKTQQAASFKNQPVTNALAASELGVDGPITRQALQGIRTQAGDAYKALKGTGTVTADDTFGKALDSIAEKYKGAADAFPGLVKSEVPGMVDALRQKSFDASGAVDAIGVLREQSNKAFAGGDKSLGKAARDAASAMEDLMSRHLEATGADPSLLKAFQDARMKIAKTYSVDKALNDSTGDVSAKALAKQLDKGAPLSGNLKTAAQFGQAFPESAQPLTRNPNALSPLDYLGGIVNAKNSVGAAAAGLALRPLLRGALLTGPYQRFATNPEALNALAGPVAYRAAPRVAQK